MGTGNESSSGSVKTTCVTLLAGLQQADDEAWRRLIEVYSPLVYAWCRRWGLTPEEAREVSQDTFREVAAVVGRFRPQGEQGGFRGWLRAIAWSKMADFGRRRSVAPTWVEGGAPAPVTQAFPPWDGASADETPDELPGVVRRTLNILRYEFEPNTWQAFWETTVQGHSTREVSAALGLSANAVRLARCKVLRRLRQELGEADGRL